MTASKAAMCARAWETKSDLERRQEGAGGSTKGRVSGGRRRNAEQRAEESGRRLRRKGSTVRRRSASRCRDLLAAMLGAQEHQAEAGDDDEEAELEVLPTLEKAVPGPEMLGDGHGEQFKKGEAEEEGG